MELESNFEGACWFSNNEGVPSNLGHSEGSSYRQPPP